MGRQASEISEILQSLIEMRENKMTIRRDTIEILDKCIESLEKVVAPLNKSTKACGGCQRPLADNEFQWRASGRGDKAIERLESLREYFRGEIAE